MVARSGEGGSAWRGVIMHAHRGIEAREATKTLRAEHKERIHAGCCKSVVVKAVVDQPTQRAALLLADSSCLLVSLVVSGSTAAVVPITVPAPCSDACFLRLHSGSGHNKFGKNSFGEVVERGALRIGPQEDSHHISSPVQELARERESAGNLLSGGNGRTGKGQGLWGATRRELFVVTARPAQGGSCTDLRAWSCGADPASFARADVELELGFNKRVIRSREGLCNSPSSMARLDAPHGLAVKTAASINVLVFYSSSAGKFWILSGKWTDQTSGGPAQTVMGNKDVFGSQGPDNRKRLVLIKCAVVRCHGPVYSIHVSPSHLFLGESKGVRVWALRPLIKPGSTSGNNSSGQSKPRQFKHVTSEQGNSYQSSNTTLDCERGCERGYRCQHGMESSGRITTEKTCIGNGNADLDANNVDLRDNMGVVAMKKLPMRKGLFSIGELDVGDSNFTGMGNYHRKLQFGSGGHSRVRSFEFWTLSQMQEALKSDSNLETLSAEEDNMAGKTLTMRNGGGGVILKNETRKGATSRSYPGEHGGISVNETLSVGPKGDSIITSSAAEGAFPSNECTGNNYLLKTAPRPRTGLITPVAEPQLVTGTHPLASQLVSEEVLQQSSPGNRVERKTNMDSSAAGMWFVALSGNNKGSPQLQVVDMQGLGLKEYVVLDSKGELHLLTLHDVSKEQRNNFVSLGNRAWFPTLRHLQITMRNVTSFAVLPLPPPLSPAHRDFVSPVTGVTAKRKLWISDGMYSVHIVILPEEKTKGTIDVTTTPTTLAVSQAVFMKDCVDGLFAGSPDTVVVLTKGKLVSYVMPGG